MWKKVSSAKLVSGINLTLQHTSLWSAFVVNCWVQHLESINGLLLRVLFYFGFESCSHRKTRQCIKHVCESVIERGRGGSRQCKSFSACHLAPAALMFWHIGKWGGRVDKDFNRILKWVMVAFMCVIVTYPKVTAPRSHHPSPACLTHASFCLTDSLKLCLFVCSQSHFHLWSSWAWATIACRSVQHRDRQTGVVSLL